MRTKTISNSDDIIESRYVIARVRDLESGLESEYESAMGEQQAEAEAAGDTFTPTPFDEWLTEESIRDASELIALRSLVDEAEGYADDWRHGATLIRDSYFEKYAQEFADDIGAVDRNAKWPTNCIDWAQAAEELQQDYTSVEFGGVTYWVR